MSGGRGPLATLREAVRALREIDARFALVGGLAASVRGEVRFTRDVDLAVAVASDAEAESIVRAMRERGFIPTATVEQRATGRMATARLVSAGDLVVDLLFATSGIEPVLVAEAEVLRLPTAGRVPVARREHLIAMKLLSVGDTRPNDRADLLALLSRPVDLHEVRRLLGTINDLGFARGEDLEHKLAVFLALAGR